MQLEDYGMSALRGFLSSFELPDVTLPSELAPVVEVAVNLSALITSGRVQHWLRAMPLVDLTGFAVTAPDDQVRAAMVRYSFLVQAYVWGEAETPSVLPANLAVPMVALADRLGQAPLLPYSGYVLDNWARIDCDGPIALDNIQMIQHFVGGDDENWFVLIHVGIEAAAGEALHLACELVDCANAGDVAGATQRLMTMAGVWARINAIFDRMPERCDPYIYYQRVRPYIHGWANNPALPDGLVYEGVARFGGIGQAYRGQTGSQSSIVPAMDALLGVDHSNDPLRAFLDELHAYRPMPHRAFIDDLRAASSLRAFAVAADDAALRQAFNAIVLAVAAFRTRHLEYAASYINRQASSGAGNDTEVGTGGTPFMKYLKKHRDENRAQVI
ncbi:MAG: indoleamine 2,3-dioxygenase [Sphingopyxis sp.]